MIVYTGLIHLQEYEADVEFTLRWRDDRLQYDPQLLLKFPIQGDHWHAKQVSGEPTIRIRLD